MPTLHVRNVPPALYASLRQCAAQRKASIASETIRLLERALRIDKPAVRELLDEINADRPVARRGTPAAAALIREGRTRRR
jgi:plasmid stability protein